MGIRKMSEQAFGELRRGRTRQDIFGELAASHPGEEVKIAYSIASIPDDKARQDYIRHNRLLCVLLVLYSIVNVFNELPIQKGEPTIFLAMTSVVPLLFAYFVYRFHGGVYRFAGLWFLVDLSETVLVKGAPDGLAVLRILTLFMLVVLSFLIARKVFPHLGMIGPRKDATGKYLL